MASTLHAFLCACAAALFWTALGLPVARRLAAPALAWSIAPALGWGLYSAAALPVFLLVGFSVTTVFAVSGVALLASAAALFATRNAAGEDTLMPGWPLALAAVGAALLALGPAVAILPKLGGDGVAFAGPMFDHSKIAIVDEMTRLGLPPGNPFFGETGVPATRLAYYYLWHFSAAAMAMLTGVSGWEADAAMTWFTAFSSLMVMIGFACWFAGRALAAFLVLLLCAAGGVRPVFNRLFGAAALDPLLEPGSGFAGWLFQAAWVPQHTASAACVVLAIFVLGQWTRRPGALPLVVFALLATASYESSTWIGAIVFPVAVAVAGMIVLIRSAPDRRLLFIAWCAVSAVLAVCLAAPMLYDQYLATAMRGGGSPVALHPYSVLGPSFPDPLRRLLDLPAYWLLLLPIELPAIYLAGSIALARSFRMPGAAPDQRDATLAFGALAAASLAVAWLFISTIGENNDLGWRAVLPGVVVLTIFAAAGLSRWLASGARMAATAAAAGILLGLPDGVGLIAGNATGEFHSDGKVFAKSPELWAAVRRHAGARERVANNPLYLEHVVPWSVNLSWALLANRRSCFAGRELTLAYTSLSNERRKAVESQFNRVFQGRAEPDDLSEFALRYDCKVVVVTPQDQAWTNDPFAASPFYRLVETSNDRWRIYRSIAAGPSP